MTGAARWVVTLVIGVVLVVAGVVMLFTPGPGVAAIVLGLYVLGREFAWAQRALDRLVEKVEERRESMPPFVGRLLDKRAAKREIRGALERVAIEAELVDEDDLPAEPGLSRSGAADEDA